MNVSVIKLNKEKDYAILAPGQISYVLNASDEELEQTKKEIEKSAKDFRIALQDKNRSSIAIMPTFDCNLRCIYCYANGGKSKESIDLNTAKKAIDYVRNDNLKAKALDLFLVGGGEPLLYFELVKKIVDYADKLFDEVAINVVTNGTFSDEVRDWLVKRRANIRISYDILGQEKHRPYYDGTNIESIVVNNISELLKKKANIIIQCIIASDTLDKMKEMVDILVNMKVSVVKFEPCLMTDVSRGTRQLQPDPIEYANRLIEVIEYVANNKLPILIDTGYFTRPTIGKYCGMGNGNFTVTPEGMITACVEVGRKSDPYSDLIMFGKIGDKVEIDEEKLDTLDKINYHNQRGGCCTCEYRLICLGGCPMANIWQNGLPLTKSKYTCTIEHIFLPKILQKIIDNEKIINVIMENPTRE